MGITDGVQGEILVSLETGAVQVYNVRGSGRNTIADLMISLIRWKS